VNPWAERPVAKKGGRWKIPPHCCIKSAMERSRHGEDTGPLRLRVLIADERPEPLERLTEVARGLGHDVVGVELAVSSAGRAIREGSPELAIVVLHQDEEHAVELVGEILDEGICPVIVQSNRDDAEFAARVAELGVFAFSTPVEPDALQAAIEVAMRRFEELAELAEQVENLEGALRRRAIVERAKGVLMERQGIDERPAFELLRNRARSTNRTLVEVAQSVLDGKPV
jgi:AmiR/NasT family two-component response regulator